MYVWAILGHVEEVLVDGKIYIDLCQLMPLLIVELNRCVSMLPEYRWINMVDSVQRECFVCLNREFHSRTSND
jgi:hypothetical protein